MKACLYIFCSTKLEKYYVGSTSDMERRLTELNRGKEKFTRTGLPWKLVYSEEFQELRDARKRELFIKKQISRKNIQQLISSAR